MAVSISNGGTTTSLETETDCPVSFLYSKCARILRTSSAVDPRHSVRKGSDHSDAEHVPITAELEAEPPVPDVSGGCRVRRGSAADPVGAHRYAATEHHRGGTSIIPQDQGAASSQASSG
jgi:hypothetical protein